MQNKITIKKVCFGYEKNRNILKNISLEIPKGIFVGVTGVNGSGKTTFTYLLNGLIPQFIKGYLTGEVFVDGVSTKTKSIAYFAQKVGMVFQNPDFSLFNLTVAEEIEFGLKNLRLDSRQKRILHSLDAVGMSSFQNRDPQTLSLGEKQKVCLACVLALDTSYIVLDEPTAMLDFKSSLELYYILSNLNRRGKTIIVVEHDTDFLRQFAHQLLILEKGEIVALGNTKDILAKKRMLQDLGIKT